MDHPINQTLPIAEAARELGMTTSAVRQRVKRGSFPAIKGEDGCWLVLVEQARKVISAVPGTTHGSTQASIPGSMGTSIQGSEHGSNGASEATIHVMTQGPPPPPDPGLVAQLRDENAFLRAELKRVGEERAEELRRKDVILSQLAQSLGEVNHRLEALPQATTSAILDAEILPDSVPRSSWWRRLFAS